MSKKLIEIASEIVQTQVSLSAMSAGEISSSLRQVFSTLTELQKAEAGEIELAKTQESTTEEPGAKALAPKDSIQENKIICLECGAEMRQLTQKHLLSHALTPREYKSKYGFTMRTSLSAKSLTKARSKAAKKRGLPENLVKAIAARKASKAAGAGSPEQVKKTGGRVARKKKA